MSIDDLNSIEVFAVTLVGGILAVCVGLMLLKFVWWILSTPFRSRATRASAAGPKVLKFRYCDGSLVESDREVELWREEADYFTGFCRTRQAEREFRKDRVLNWFDGTEAHLQQRREQGIRRRWIFDAPDGAVEVYVAGFPMYEQTVLQDLAARARFNVRERWAKTVAVACLGPRAGAAVRDRARAQKVSVLDMDQFIRLTETGELPDDA